MIFLTIFLQLNNTGGDLSDDNSAGKVLEIDKVDSPP